MKNFESGRSSWRDQELDSLLHDFFRDEWPEELRDLPLHPETSSLTLRPARREQRGAALAVGLTAVAVTLMLAVLTSWSPPVDRGGLPLGVVGNDAPAGDGLPNPSEETLHEFTVSPWESSVVERYDTPNGPVEERIDIRWTNVVLEKESGTDVEVIIPEVRIEIFEIEDKKKEDK